MATKKKSSIKKVKPAKDTGVSKLKTKKATPKKAVPPAAAKAKAAQKLKTAVPAKISKVQRPVA